MATKKKAAAPKKAAKKSKKESTSAAVVPAPEAPVAPRSVAQIMDDVKKPGGEKFEGELLEASGVGSEFVRIASGWRVKIVDGGTVITSSGPTIRDAVSAHGEQIDHSKV